VSSHRGRKHYEDPQKVAIVVGVLFILATVLCLIESTLIGNVIGTPLAGAATGTSNYLANAADNENQVISGALFE
jgi:uncharacterized MnhB-related membrane protein